MGVGSSYEGLGGGLFESDFVFGCPRLNRSVLSIRIRISDSIRSETEM